MKIFGWAGDHGGCGQYRIGMPMWGLSQLGHDATAFSVLDVELPEDLDVFVGQRVAEQERCEVWLATAARPDRVTAMIFEIDDDVWNIHPSNVLASRLREAEVQARVEEGIRRSDAVTVTSDFLGEVVSRINPNVHVLPNSIDEALLQHERPRNERLTIGWAGGSSHANDFDFVRGQLRTFFRRHPDVDMHFVGATHGAEIGRPDARRTAWNLNLIDYLKAIDFDIGIAPLAYNRFNRSKSDLKFLEYAALGIPVVASDFGPYAESIEHGVTGLLVKHPHEWGTHLRALVEDEAMREEIGANARRWAATRTIQTNAWRWEQVYQSVYAGRLLSMVPTL